jgi:hypothetical protein
MNPRGICCSPQEYTRMCPDIARICEQFLGICCLLQESAIHFYFLMISTRICFFPYGFLDLNCKMTKYTGWVTVAHKDELSMREFFGKLEFYLRRGLTLIEILNTVDRKIGLPDKGNDESCSENREKYIHTLWQIPSFKWVIRYCA